MYSLFPYMIEGRAINPKDMMKLCCSAPNIKLTRERHKSISGWANPYQTRKRGKVMTKPGNKKYVNGLFESNRKNGTRKVIFQSIRLEIRLSAKRLYIGG